MGFSKDNFLTIRRRNSPIHISVTSHPISKMYIYYRYLLKMYCTLQISRDSGEIVFLYYISSNKLLNPRKFFQKFNKKDKIKQGFHRRFGEIFDGLIFDFPIDIVCTDTVFRAQINRFAHQINYFYFCRCFAQV